MANKNSSKCKCNDITRQNYVKLADKAIDEAKKNVDAIEERVLRLHNKISILL